MSLALGNGRLRSAILLPCRQAPCQVLVRKQLIHMCSQPGIPEQEGIKTLILVPFNREGCQPGIPEQEGIKTALRSSFRAVQPTRYP